MLKSRNILGSKVATSKNEDNIITAATPMAGSSATPSSSPMSSDNKKKKEIGFTATTSTTNNKEVENKGESIEEAVPGTSIKEAVIPSRFLKSVKYNSNNQSSAISSPNLHKLEDGIRNACCISIVLWIVLVGIVIVVTPKKNFVSLNKIETNSAWIAFLLILLSFVSRLIPLMYRRTTTTVTTDGNSNNANNKSIVSIRSCYGVILGAVVVQSIAMLTDLSMALLPTPVLIDPITGTRVFLLRWCEWAPLAFLMTFMTEVVGIDCKEDSDGDDLSVAYTLAALQGLSTVCGLIFPFCSSQRMWKCVMTISFLTYLTIFPRLYKRWVQCRDAEKSKGTGTANATTVLEGENYDRRRLSYQLMLLCVITWTTLVIFYFVSWLGPLYSHPSSLLRVKEAPMIIECFLDVLAKVGYLLAIVEIHMVIFDDDVRAARRLREMRHMMSAVWESSSDVIAISVRGMSGKVTTMLSPTYKRLFDLDKVSSKPLKKSNTDEDQSKVVVFDLDDSDFQAFQKNNTSVSPKLSFVETNNNQTSTDPQDDQPLDKSELISIGDLVVKAWNLEKREHLLHHNVPRSDGVVLNFEANVTWTEQNCLIIVMRDITERVMRFEAEKRIVSESTARAKDAEANRFTRHEVKNGLLTTIELCRTLRQAYDVQLESGVINGAKVLLKCSDSDDGDMDQNIDVQEYFNDLKYTLNDILDTILSEVMARDVINETYQPKLEKVDIRNVLCGTGTKSRVDYERFPFVSFPSPLPKFLFDAQLLKHIHQNAISNACKYGKPKGIVLTQIQYECTNRELEMSVINLPGPNHEQLLAVSTTRANQTVFAQGTRFSIHDEHTAHSSGDGAWIMSKCAKVLGGECAMKFEPKRTVFTFRCPATSYHESLQRTMCNINTFRVPSSTWGIVIDDSKMQRKMLDRFLSIVGVYTDKRIILGQSEAEITSFNDVVVNMIQKEEHSESYFLLIVDENLNLSDDINSSCISGSTCVEEIRARLDADDEHRVLALVRSANDHMDDVSIYRRRAHDYLPKSSMNRNSVLELFVPIWSNRFPHLKCSTSSTDLNGKRQTSIEIGMNNITAASSSSTASSAVVDSQPREAILQTVDVIDALVHEESLLARRWAMVWNKLHLLKGDMMSSEQYSNRLRFATHGIEKLRGNSMPNDFIQWWRETRAFILSSIENTNSASNSNVGTASTRTRTSSLTMRSNNDTLN